MTVCLIKKIYKTSSNQIKTFLFKILDDTPDSITKKSSKIKLLKLASPDLCFLSAVLKYFFFILSSSPAKIRDEFLLRS